MLNLQFQTFGAQGFARVCGPAVLPDDRRRDRRGARPVPDQRGFALIGDADGRDAIRAADMGDDIPAHLHRLLPDLDSILFDPAIMRIRQRHLFLCVCDRIEIAIESDRPRRRGALINHQNQLWFRHRVQPPQRLALSKVNPSRSSPDPSQASFFIDVRFRTTRLTMSTSYFDERT